MGQPDGLHGGMGKYRSENYEIMSLLAKRLIEMLLAVGMSLIIWLITKYSFHQKINYTDAMILVYVLMIYFKSESNSSSIRASDLNIPFTRSKL